MLVPKFKVIESTIICIWMICNILIIQEVQCLSEWGGGGSQRQTLAYNTNERREALLVHSRNYKKPRIMNEANAVLFPGPKNDNHVENPPSTTTILASRGKIWPPWPLSLLGKRPSKDDDDDDDEEVVTAANTYPSAAALMLAYGRQRALVIIRQCQEVGSQLWFHLPPAAPPLILLASIPRTMMIDNQKTKVVPLLSIPFARNLALAGLGFAVMSWAHMELHRKRKLAPLLLPYDRVSSVFLPPFLPAEVPEPELDALDIEEKTAKGQNTTTSATIEESSDNSVINLVRPKIRQIYDLYENAPRPSIIKELKRKRTQRRREAAKIRRLSVFDELVALQAIKRKTQRLSAKSKKPDVRPGYALVTGASQGIGRAIAVELARWEIPLILVARDIDRLVSLAYDLEACYGVKCCVLSADLSDIDSADRIHESTKKAGLTVDILVNNAGIALDGLAVDTPTQDLERMMMVNTMSFAKLSKLYGQDMKRRRRGRILMVSSMSGLTCSSANCAFYGATKAFGKSLALSMAKELEPHGVGVTALLPGPVTATKFRDRSGTGRALCWYVPFYPRSPEAVAHLGVMSLLDGDVQTIPGIQNRVFAKIIKPIIPQRLETAIVQAAWSPFDWSFGRRKEEESVKGVTDLGANQQDDEFSSPQVPLDLKPRYSFQMPPIMLKLPKPDGERMSPEPMTETSPIESKNEAKGEMEINGESKKMQADPTASESVSGKNVLNLDAAEESPKEENQKDKDLGEFEDESTANTNPENGDGKGDQPVSTSPLSNQIPKKPETSTDKVQRSDEQVTQNGNSESSCVGTKLNRNERKYSRANNDDCVGYEYGHNDRGISPKLGPVDLFQNREFVLPNANRTLEAAEHLLYV